MTSFKFTHHSVVVLPPNSVILAKTISQGGELILMNNERPADHRLCDSDFRKGKVCYLGPMGELITVKGIKMQPRSLSRCQQPLDKPRPCAQGEIVSTLPRSLPYFQQLYPEVKGLPGQESKHKRETKAEEARVVEQLEQVKKPEPTDPIMNEAEASQQHPGGRKPDVEEGREQHPGGKKPDIEESSQQHPGEKISDIEEAGHQHPGGMKEDIDEKQMAPSSEFTERFCVLVKWKQHANIPCYTARSVYTVLSKKYGNILAMGQLSINSCLVLFEKFHAAILAVRDCHIGPKAYPLICQWYHLQMYRDSIDLLDIHPYRKIKIVSEEAKKMRRFQDMQDQVLSSLKHRANSLSYNRATFRP